MPEGTKLTVNPTSGVYNGSTPVSGTLTNTYTGQPVPGEPVTLTVNGTQSCTATTNAQGVATCDISPNEPAGNYTLSGAFPGDTNSHAAVAIHQRVDAHSRSRRRRPASPTPARPR